MLLSNRGRFYAYSKVFVNRADACSEARRWRDDDLREVRSDGRQSRLPYHATYTVVQFLNEKECEHQFTGRAEYEQPPDPAVEVAPPLQNADAVAEYEQPPDPAVEVAPPLLIADAVVDADVDGTP